MSKVKEKRFTIVYSNSVAVFDGDKRIGAFPFGVIHTPEFKQYKSKLLEHGEVKETGSFYPKKQISEEIIIPEILPRPYQQRVVDIACSYGVYNGIFEAPTGSGKTNMIAYLAAKMNFTTIIIVPTADLTDQTYNRILSVFGLSEEENLERKMAGILGNGKKEFGRPILITTWHSLMNETSRSKVLEYGYYMLICDEVHRASANLLSQYIGMFKSRYKFGFSASVYRSRKEQIDTIHSLVGPKVHSVDIDELYNDGFILKPRIYKISINFSANVEIGIRYHYAESLKNKKKMRYAIANTLFSNSQYRAFRPENKNVFSMMNNPDEDDIKVLTNVAILMKAESQKAAEAEERNTLTEEQLVEAKKKRSSISIGLAKKGIDNYSKRKLVIHSGILSRLNDPNIRERAAILANSIAAGDAIADMLASNGYRNVIVINGSEENKKENVKLLSSGQIDDFIIISTVQFLSEGTDIPKLAKVFIASPVFPPYTSIERLQQIAGRAVRVDASNEHKIPEIYVFDDKNTDGITASKKDLMWHHCQHAFKVEIIDDNFFPLHSTAGQECLPSNPINKN